MRAAEPVVVARLRDSGFAGAHRVLERTRDALTSGAASCRPELRPELQPELQPGWRVTLAQAAPAGAEADPAAMAGRARTAELAVAGLGGRLDLARGEELTALAGAQPASLLITDGWPADAVREAARTLGLPALALATPEREPWRVLADLAVIASREPELHRVRVAWVGPGGPLADAWIEAAIYMPIELFMAVPEGREPDMNALGLALQAGAKVFVTYDHELALDGAHYVCTPAGDSPAARLPGVRPVDRALLEAASPTVRVLAAGSRRPHVTDDAAEAVLDPNVEAGGTTADSLLLTELLREVLGAPEPQA